ncbi:hypothetical protein [Gimesia sp.]
MIATIMSRNYKSGKYKGIHSREFLLKDRRTLPGFISDMYVSLSAPLFL